jgi:O-acetyl-ADP-ribose deacetylase (regulator of RNase III)
VALVVRIVTGDITKLAVDAIVNAANPYLGGADPAGTAGGVDGAIHRAAGPGLHAECLSLGGCETGDAKITHAYELPCRYVIHTVGPRWNGGEHGESALLARCYRRCLELADSFGLRSIAFPSISTGSYGFPRDPASQIAVDSVFEFAVSDNVQREVTFCCFSSSDTSRYQAVLDAKLADQIDTSRES